MINFGQAVVGPFDLGFRAVFGALKDRIVVFGRVKFRDLVVEAEEQVVGEAMGGAGYVGEYAPEH